MIKYHQKIVNDIFERVGILNSLFSAAADESLKVTVEIGGSVCGEVPRVLLRVEIHKECRPDHQTTLKED